MHLEYIYRSFHLTKSIWSLCQSLSCSSASSITVCGTSPRTPSLSETLSNESKKYWNFTNIDQCVKKYENFRITFIVSNNTEISFGYWTTTAVYTPNSQNYCIYPHEHLKNWQSITPSEYLTSLWRPCCSNLLHF